MRDLMECKAEVYRRSEERIAARKKACHRLLALCIPICLIVAVWAVRAMPSPLPDGAGEIDSEMHSLDGFDGRDGTTGLAGSDSLEGFSFSLTWGCYGISSYDSDTGELVKTKDATDPENYATTLRLTKEQKLMIYDLIMNLNVESYPDTYHPHEDGIASSPSMTLILTVRTKTVNKTITAENIAMTFESQEVDGQRFLSVCKAIRDILLETDEWKSLPEYESFYD